MTYFPMIECLSTTTHRFAGFMVEKNRSFPCCWLHRSKVLEVEVVICPLVVVVVLVKNHKIKNGQKNLLKTRA